MAADRVLDDHLHRRTAEHPRGAVRGGAHRRRRGLAAIPARNAADARFDLPLRRHRHGHRLSAAHRGALCDDRRRAAQQDHLRRHADVPARVQVVADGVCRSGGLRALPHHRRGNAHPDEVAGGTALRKSVLLHAALIVGSLATLFPLVWMLSASFMTSGEATTYPPHLIPHAATLNQYRQLFIRMNIGRAFLSSAIVALLVTSCSLVFNSMAGYAFAKLRFPGRDRLFGWLLLALIIP